MYINSHPKSFAVCVTHCYKCRIFKRKFPHARVIEIRNSIEGLGDIISIITYYLHIPHCSSCERRRNILNEKFPLKWLIPDSFRNPTDNMEVRDFLKKYKRVKYPLVFDWNGKVFLVPKSTSS